MYDRSGQIWVANILFFFLSWVSVSLRIYVKARMLKQFGWDDRMMMATLAFFTAYLSCQIGGLIHGTGKHRSELTDENAQTALRFWFFCEIFYTISTCFLKVAVGLFFLRIAVVKYHVWIIKLIMYCSAVCGLVYCCIVLFQCNPISFWWDLNPNHHGKCLSPKAVIYTTYVISSLNSLADWVFGILPIFIVKDLQMRSHTKIVVAFVLGFAAVGSTATIVRMPYIWTLEHYKGDFLWRTSDVAIWTTVEVGIGITAGNIATLRPLMQRIAAALGITPTTVTPSTAKWGPSSRGGSKGYIHKDHVLEDLTKSGKGAATKTTVTIRGGNDRSDWANASRTDSEEGFVPEFLNSFEGGILQKVEINTVEERAYSANPCSESDEEKGMPTNPIQAYERL